MEVSLFPAWAGTKQPRLAHVEGDALQLSTEVQFSLAVNR